MTTLIDHDRQPRNAPAGEGSTPGTGLSRFPGWSRAVVRRGGSIGVLAPLIILWLVLAITVPGFLAVDNVKNILLQGSIVGVMAMCTTLVILTEEIDLSLGAVEGLAAIMSATLMVRLDLPWFAGIAGGVGVGMIVGVINGLVTTRIGVPSFVTTLATLGIATGVAQNISGGQSLFGFPHEFQWLGGGQILGIGVPVFVACLVLGVLFWLLRGTRTGYNMYAVGGNARAARLVGINPANIKTLAFVISGAGAGLAGVLVSAQLNSASSQFGTNDLLNAIAAVVIGGTALKGGRGSVVDTALGVLVIVTVANGLNLLNVSPFWQQSAVGGIILLVAIIDRRNRASVGAS